MSAPVEVGPLGRRMTLPSAAAYLGMTPAALTHLANSGGITHHRRSPRGFRFFYEKELDAYLAQTRVRATAPSTGQRRRSVAHLMPAERELRD